MTTLRIKLKIGEHEFEAEGAPDIVQAQLGVFVRLSGLEGRLASSQSAVVGMSPSVSVVDDISHVNDRIVSLETRPESVSDAVLVLLLGQGQLRGNSAVTGAEIMEGLRASGYKAQRADLILKRHAATGNVVMSGKRRQKRYRLTTDGVGKAERIVQTLAAGRS